MEFKFFERGGVPLREEANGELELAFEVVDAEGVVGVGGEFFSRNLTLPSR